MRKIFKIRETAEKEFYKEVKKFNRVLAANKMKTIKPIACGEIQIELKNKNGISYFVPGTQYAVEYPEEILKLENMLYIGCYRYVGDVWMRHTESENEEDNAFICEENRRCDMCGKHINTRKSYFFFKNFETSEYKVYGKGCANATIGFDCESIFNKMAEFEHKSTYGYCGCRDKDNDDWNVKYDTDTMVKVIKTVTNAFSVWLNRSKANQDGKVCTANKIIEAIWGDTELGTDNDLDTKSIIEDARKYWNHQQGNNDLVVNAREILEENYISRKWCGIYGYAIYRSEAEKIKNRTAPKIVSNSKFIGTVGERLRGIYTPISSSRYYGYDYLGNEEERSRLVMKDSIGNEFVCFCTSMRIIQLMESCLNQPLSCAFTVKDHETYRGIDRTIVNRIKVYND